MIGTPFDINYTENSPINSIEEFAEAKGWLAVRCDENKLRISISDNDMNLEIDLEWQEEFTALLTSCVVPVEISDKNYEMVTQAMEKINSDMWLGHFDLSTEGRFPTFRHTTLLRLIPTGIAANLVADVIEIAVAECQRFYNTFQLAKAGDVRLHDDLQAAVFKTVGKA